MNVRYLETVAGAVIAQTMRSLPETVRCAAEGCVIEIAFMKACLVAQERMEEDLLGLFEGCPHGEMESGCTLADLPRIRLFLDNLWDYAGHDRALFRDEVRLTLLHELGHYLGLDEQQVEALGLA
jgi:predicted Zn-dependent protease with MMP-like domain